MVRASLGSFVDSFLVFSPCYNLPALSLCASASSSLCRFVRLRYAAGASSLTSARTGVTLGALLCLGAITSALFDVWFIQLIWCMLLLFAFSRCCFFAKHQLIQGWAESWTLPPGIRRVSIQRRQRDTNYRITEIFPWDSEERNQETPPPGVASRKEQKKASWQ